MTPFWIINAALWTALFFYVLPGAWAAATNRGVRRNDPVRLSMALSAVMMAGFSYRWLLFPDSQIAWQALYLLSAAIAIYKAIIANAYGRGPRI